MLQGVGIGGAFGAKIVFGEPVADLRLFQYPIHEPAPHAIPAVALAGLLIDIPFPLAIAEQERRQCRPRLPGQFRCCSQLRCPFVNRTLAGGSCGLMALHVDPVFLQAAGGQSQQITPCQACHQL